MKNILTVLIFLAVLAGFSCDKDGDGDLVSSCPNGEEATLLDISDIATCSWKFNLPNTSLMVMNDLNTFTDINLISGNQYLIEYEIDSFQVTTCIAGWPAEITCLEAL